MISDPLPRHLSRRALRLRISETYGGDRARFLASLSDTMNQAMRDDLKRARSLAGRIASITSLFTGGDRAMLLRIGARYHHLSGNAPMALKMYRRAGAIYRNAGEDIAAARVSRAMVDVLMYLGRYKEAEQTGRSALRRFRQRKMDLEWAQTVCNVGNVYHRQDDNPRALKAYDSALPIIRSSGQKPALALIQFNRGNILANLHRVDEAAACYGESRSLYTESGMALAANQAEYSLAYLAFLRGQFADSLMRFEKVLNSFEALGDRRGRAHSRLDMLEIQLQLNLFTVVEADAPAIALLFRQLRMHYEEAKCRYFLAKARAALEDTAGAQKAIKEARRLLQGEGNLVWNGSVDLLEARLTAFSRKPADARSKATSAARCFRRAGDLRRHAAASLLLADLDIADDRLVQSQRRLAPYLRQESAYPASVVFEAWWMQGRVQRASGDIDGSIHSYERAISRAERMVEGVPADETRIFYLSDKLAVYHELVGLLLAKKKYREAVNVLEHARHVRRNSYRPTAIAAAADAIPERLRRKQEALRSRLHRLYGFPASLDRFAPASMETMRRTEDQLWRLIGRGRRLASGPHRDRSTAPSSFTRMEMPAGRAILTFATDGDTPCVFILIGSRILCRHLPVTWDHLRALLARFYFFIEKNRIPGGFRARHESEVITGANNQLMDLSQATLWPLLADLAGVHDLTFIPIDQLSAVPFHALPQPDGQPLSLTHTVRFGVDLASTVGRTQAKLSAKASGAIFSPGRLETAEMDSEAAEICRLFPDSSHFQGEQASGAQLRQSLVGNADFLHIASHASAALDNPIFSEILLNDGPFYAFDLFEQPVRQALVTLAACQTGRPGVLPSGEVYGLAEAFMSQGARSVLSSLWTVDDRTARMFMTRFYGHISKGYGLNHAWTTAVHELRQLHANPYHWAPYVLIGSTD
jgi:tetratricopeptide (TPR) repeat protein